MQKHKLLLLQNIVRKGISAPHAFFFHPPFLQEHASPPPPPSTMKTWNDTYIQGKQEHCDQDVIKSCSSYICLTPARKNIQTNSIPPFLQNPPFLGCPLPFSNFSIPLFLRFLVSSIPPLVLFDQSNNNSSIDVKMDESVLEAKSSFKGGVDLKLGLTFSSKLDWALTLSLLLKLPPRKLEL